MDRDLNPGRIFRKEFQANDLSTRQVLKDLRATLATGGATSALEARVETVLAELLNNIAEHAYENRGQGVVCVDVQAEGSLLRIGLADCGQPLPGERLPDGHLPTTDVALCDLPEGGFGWHLIRAQSDSVHYERAGDQNLTTVTFDCRRDGP